MKFTLTFKTPDVLLNYLERHDDWITIEAGAEDEFAKENLICEMKTVFEKFTTDGELLKVEFDTDAQTATVVEQK